MLGVVGKIVASHLRDQEDDGASYDLAVPRPAPLIESLRAFGYDLTTAVADLVDNSISAGAENVWLTFEWDGGDSYVVIRDDGRGMTEPDLVEAMRPGTRSPLEERDPEDLGRFGLGLKTASFSQCRRLTVWSRAKGQQPAVRRWDLDYVNQTKEWRLLRAAHPDSETILGRIKTRTSGTIVLWECLDRVVGEASTDDNQAHDRFLEHVDGVKTHLGMVFHRFLEGRASLVIWINGRKIEPWDPFLKGDSATQSLPPEGLSFKKEQVKIRPYVLPHHSKIDQTTHDRAAGPRGWNAHQGFYVYRKKRLLVAGDWLGLGIKKEEHHKLARIQVDLPNSMDSDWELDVRKSRAAPPSALRKDLKRIARLTRQAACEIYRHRGKIISRTSDNDVLLWLRRVKEGKVSYVINREHPLLAEVLRSSGAATPSLRFLLKLLEQTVPISTIAIDSAERPDAFANPFDREAAPEVAHAMSLVYRAYRRDGLAPEQARKRLLALEPFHQFAELVASMPDSTSEGTE
jgi:hypothetical protein